MTPWLDDGDIRLYHGDALETVRGLSDESVDCVVTSPPYWGLRDYGTGEWEGGDHDCDHMDTAFNAIPQNREGRETPGGRGGSFPTTERQFKDVCGKCGARRVDRQMGLEPTPDLFVAGMVELFREIRRVLAPHGTCWVNLGDSYANSQPGGGSVFDNGRTDGRQSYEGDKVRGRERTSTLAPGLKPKDLCGIPWRVAFALQADGWWLRSDIIWAKPNPMPESVTDRPAKAHEYVFLLTKQPRYWFDSEAIREPHNDVNRPNGPSGGDGVSRAETATPNQGWAGTKFVRRHNEYNPNGRNSRSVWNIATQPYPEAHFATFPEELARRCILAGCPTRVCRVCGKPSERIVEDAPDYAEAKAALREKRTGMRNNDLATFGLSQGTGAANPSISRQTVDVGWSDCGHNDWRPGVTLDPFIGSGTVAKVARDHQRHAIGIDLNETYLELAARRLQQLSLLT